MKKTLLAALLLLPVLPLSGPAFAETILAQDAPAYFGRSVTVVGRTHVQRMASGEIYLDVQNVTNHSNPEEIVYNTTYTQRGYITGLPILPVFGARVTW